MMNPELDRIKKNLETHKAELLQRISKVKKDIGKEYSANWAEQAQERQNDEVLDAIGIESRAELFLIDRALKRMTSGEYTNCSYCGKHISMQRLNAVPYTHLCIQCAEKESIE